MRRRRAPAHPSEWLSRLEEVRETGDRRASGTLLDAFLADETTDERRCEIGQALRVLEDTRCAERLRRAVLDIELPEVTRSLALEVYAAIPVDVPSREEALEWTRAPDVVTRAFGVRALDVPDGDLLAKASGDAAPLVRYAAVDAMASIVRTRPLVEATRRALGDEDAAIREAACRVALFDEPLDATHELLRALGDDSSAVRVAACDALEDFPRVSVLLALAEARDPSDAGLAARLAFEGITRRIRASMAEASPRALRRLGRWAAPVEWLLNEPEGDAFDQAVERAVEEGFEEADGSGGRAAYEGIELDEARAVLFDADAPAVAQRRMLVFRKWAGTGDAGLAILRECAASPNWSLRQGAAFGLGDLGAAADLVALAGDREPVVRRAAFEELRSLEDARGLGPALETLLDPVMRPIAGDDALALVAEVGKPSLAARAIVAELARDDDRDGLWLGAIHLAQHFEIAGAAPHLGRIAESPVEASVLPHVAALAALRELGRRRARLDLGHLEPLDHLEVQRELGEWDWHGTRYG